MTSPGAHGEGEGVVVLWKEYGYRPFLDGWNEDPAHKGGEDSVEGRWMPLDTYNALLARANTAKADAEKAERERDEVVEALRGVVRPYIVARGTDPVFWGANVLSMIDDIIARAAIGREGA